jgi:subtilase family serine protease
MSVIRRLLVLLLFVFVLPAPEARAGETGEVCGPTRPMVMRCHAIARATGSRAPAGLSPAAMKKAYGFPTSSTAGQGKTIAVVAAYNAPHAERDLNVFSKTYGLPPCTRANGCFLKVNQRGRTNSFPPTDPGWALEIAMDIQWVHAIAPGAKILLVEADDAYLHNLAAAVAYAKKRAKYVTNSWGGDEFSTEKDWDRYWAEPGVSVFFSSGDSGLGAEYPSSSPNVVSVGGTTIRGIGTSSFSETGWSGSGGGCSDYEIASKAQMQFSQYSQVSCRGRRATPDLSLVGDPATGAAVYSSTPYEGSTGWYVLGGTSLSSPMVAARSAISGAVVNHTYVYGTKPKYRDITSGYNGARCLVGYDLVTGRGSRIG